MLIRKPPPKPETEVVLAWSALPGSQKGFYNYDADIILYHGTRGPGKTDAQLMRFARRCGLGYGPFWRGIIFDHEYKNLEDIIGKSKRWFPKLIDKDGSAPKFYTSKSDLKWVFPDGEELLFRHAAVKSDYDKYHGHEYPYIGWNELTKYANSDLFDMMMSCNRSSYTPEKDGFIRRGAQPQKEGPPKWFGPDGSFGYPPPIPLEVTATTNPHGVGHNWVKRQFITPSPAGIPIITNTKVYDPKTKEDVIVTKAQVAIFGSYRENPYLSPAYIASIKNIRDKNRRKAWLSGSWDIVAGGAFDDVWDKTQHVIPQFKVPSNWRLDRTFDWGSSHPASVGFWAEANGEETLLPNGKIFCPSAGSLIRISEIYFTQGIGTNIGLKMSAENIAKAIKEHEAQLIELGWVMRKFSAGPADNQIRDVTQSDVETIEKKMQDAGVYWEASNKSKGSRVNGMQIAREMFEAVTEHNGNPGLYFTENCRAAIDIIPTLPRDETNIDDVDTKSEDHIWDEVRYRVLKGSNRFVTSLDVQFPT